MVDSCFVALPVVLFLYRFIGSPWCRPPYQGVAPPKLAANLTVWTTMIDALLETTPHKVPY